MKILDLFKRNKPVVKEQYLSHPSAYAQVVSVSFDGEKELGGMGPIMDYQVDYEALRMRSWQAYLDSPVCQMVFKRFSTWVIGQGLRLGADPMTSVLKAAGISDDKDFIANVEDRFKVYAQSKICDYSGNNDLNSLMKQAHINSIIGGDVLVIQRVEDGIVTVQLIDGAYVSTPYGQSTVSSGNKIKHGVEIDKKGRRVAYHVRGKDMQWKRVEARSKNGIDMAFLVYGLEYRLDDVRGLPLISAVMETAKKLERYQDATLTSAEEGAKIPFSIEHNFTSTGENPFLTGLAKASGFGKPGDNPETEDGVKLQNRVAATVNKQVVNMPVGASMKAFESKKEMQFNDFFTVNIQIVCSTIGIPPEVALMKYDSNFSASRAALKDWEHTLLVLRDSFSKQFNKPNYKLWLTNEILSSRVKAAGFLNALSTKDIMIVEAWCMCRFSGANVPHIDPLKEVNAERAKLGDMGVNIPLTTAERATEALNGGDVYTNILEFSNELKEMGNKGLIVGAE